jgi:hypothetical protein
MGLTVTEHGSMIEINRYPRGFGRRASIGLIIAAVGLLAGCDSTAKINEARPVDRAVADQWDNLLDLYAEGDDRETLKRDYENRLRARALSCSGGYQPWFFSSRESVRAKLNDTNCFERIDRDLQEWVSRTALKTLSAMPALRPIPEELPELIVASKPVGQVFVASEAGVAAIGSYGSAVEIVDIGTSDTIFVEEAVRLNSTLVSISPNGRLYAVLEGGGETLSIRDSTNGKALATYSGYLRFQWLESSLALAMESRSQVTAIDLATGATSPVKGVTSGQFIAQKTGKPSTYVAVSGLSLIEFEVRRKEQALIAKLVKETPIQSNSAFSRGPPAINDGKAVFSAGEGLLVLDLASQVTRITPLAGFRVASTLPLPAAGEFLVALQRMNSRGDAPIYVVFFADDEKLAVVTETFFESYKGFGFEAFFFVPSLDRLAARNAKSIRLIETVARGPKMSAQGFIALYAPEDGLVESSAIALPLTQAAGSALNERAIGTESSLRQPRTTPSLLAIAAGARVEAVGVYESAAAKRVSGQSKAGPVQVNVRRGSRSTVLVLTSYEPVDWQVSATGSGQGIRAVLLGGYHDSTVTGAGDARIVRIGRVYAYEKEATAFSALDNEVKRQIGRPIDAFQGAYKASSFVVGGR